MNRTRAAGRAQIPARRRPTYAGLLRGLDRATVTERTDDLLGAMDLREAGDSLVVDFSAGMSKKVLLAAALVHNPEVVVLDEPFVLATGTTDEVRAGRSLDARAPELLQQVAAIR